MITEYTGGKLKWIDVHNPTSEEARELLLAHGLSPSMLDDITTPGSRDAVFFADSAIKATLHFPIVKRADIDHPHEVQFIVTKTALVTIRYEDMEAIHRFQKEFEVLGTLYKTNRRANGAHLFAAMLREFYHTLDAKLDYLETRMKDIEREIFNEREKEMVFSISEVSRKLITYRQTIKSHTKLLSEISLIIENKFNATTASQFTNIIQQHVALNTRTNGLFDTLDELRNTNLAMLTTKQNEVMKILTILAFITFPLSLFTSMFGMNTAATPILGLPGDFWIIVGIMTGATVAFFGYFKYKHWI